MPDAAEQPTSAQPLRPWRPMAAWTVGILLAAGLAWFAGAVVMPVWQTKRVVYRYNHTIADVNPLDAVDELGGPRKAARRLGLFVRMPRWITGPDDPGSADGGDRLVAINLLGFCGKVAVPALIKELHSPSPMCRAHAARSLGIIGPDAQAALPDLIAALNDEAEIQTQVYWGHSPVNPGEPANTQMIWALGQIGPAAGPAAPHLVKLMDASCEVTRRSAAEALKKIRGEEAPK